MTQSGQSWSNFSQPLQTPAQAPRALIGRLSGGVKIALKALFDRPGLGRGRRGPVASVGAGRRPAFWTTPSLSIVLFSLPLFPGCPHAPATAVSHYTRCLLHSPSTTPCADRHKPACRLLELLRRLPRDRRAFLSRPIGQSYPQHTSSEPYLYIRSTSTLSHPPSLRPRILQQRYRAAFDAPDRGSGSEWNWSSDCRLSRHRVALRCGILECVPQPTSTLATPAPDSHLRPGFPITNSLTAYSPYTFAHHVVATITARHRPAAYTLKLWHTTRSVRRYLAQRTTKDGPPELGALINRATPPWHRTRTRQSRSPIAHPTFIIRQPCRCRLSRASPTA